MAVPNQAPAKPSFLDCAQAVREAIKKEDKMSRYESEPFIPKIKSETCIHEINNDISVDIQAPDSDAKEARSYLHKRLERVHLKLTSKLLIQFGLKEDDAPRTPDELVERIKDGKYVILEKDKDRRTFSPVDYIEWRDPDIKHDEKGYAEACEVLDKEYTKVRDTIAIFSAEKGLEAIQELEKWEYKKSRK